MKSGTKKKFKGTCNWCGKVGHKEKQCFVKKRGEPRAVPEKSNNVKDEEEVLACMCVVALKGHETQNSMKECKKDHKSWLADSGASSHLTNDSACMKNYTGQCRYLSE